MGNNARRAAIFVQRGPLDRKQETACLAYCMEQRWSMFGLVPWWAREDAVTMVRTGEVDTILVAYDSNVAQQLADDIGSAGRVVVVHPHPHELHPRRVWPSVLVDLVVRWSHRGRPVKEIAEDLDTPTGEVRAILREAGEHPDRTD